MRGSVSRSSSSPFVAPPQSPRTPRRRTHPTRAQRDKGHGGIETLAGGATPRPASTRPAVGLAPATGHHTTHATQSTVRHARAMVAPALGVCSSSIPLPCAPPLRQLLSRVI